ncbi:MAG: carbon-nitrogen hydrolase family protein, partial [Gemmatimonadota bacterium]|nr:carbon-nitrogen hydrolase family protein [Gemmatimonadota bacterium]
MTEKNNHKLRVAVVQFPVSGDMDRNYRYMASWIRRAAEKGAELVHFPETALTGYYKVHLDDTSEIDRGLLEECSLRLRSLAGELGLWLTYGSTHFTADSEKPYNCLYLVGPDGEETCRYDKVFLTDTDVECYAPGNRLVTAGVKGFKVGLTICFDMRFPELFRKYMADGVNLFLISSYQAGGHRADHMRKVAPSTLITRAAENGIFISAANTSQRPSWHESMIISFNGIVLAKARRHRASMAVATL